MSASRVRRRLRPLSGFAAAWLLSAAAMAGDEAPTASGQAAEKAPPREGDRAGAEEGTEAARTAPSEALPMVVPDFSRQPEPPGAPVERERYRWIWRNLTVGRVNPLGSLNMFRTGLRVQLSDAPGVLWEQSYAAMLLHTAVSPAFGHFGGRLELAPAAVLRLSAQYDYFQTWGEFNHLQTFETPAAEYDDELLEDTRDQNQAVGGHAVELEALLQAKVGPVAVRNLFNAYTYRMNVPRDRVFYDGTHDALHPNGGWGVQDDVDLLYLFHFGLKIGARYTFHRVFYSDRFEVEGTAAEDNTPTHRVGPAVLYTFFEDPPGVGWNEPTAGVLAQWWLKHRYRTGQDIPQAIPYLLVVIAQKGDFLP